MAADDRNKPRQKTANPGRQRRSSENRKESVPPEKTPEFNQNSSKAEQKQKRGEKNIASRLLKKIRKLFLFLFLAMLILVIAGGFWFYFNYGRTILRLQTTAKRYAAASSIETFRQNQTSLVYAADGTLISKLKGEKDVYYLSYEAIPQAAVQAMLATEDRKFFEHSGVDLLANIRASIVLIKNKGEIHQGASTITQQLARNIFLSNEVTWERKITEIFLAGELEKRYSKKQILEFYMNNIYFANGYYGLQAAANGYFSRGAQELTLSELAFLCAIPNNPTKYNPLTKFENVLERRDKVLQQMKDEKFITAEDYKKAVKETITLQINTTEMKNYVESYTYYCAIRALMEREGFVFKNIFSDETEKEEYEERYYEAYYRIQKTLFTGGYRIYTSIDLRKQEQLQEAVNEVLADFTETSEEGIYKLQGAAVCIDNDSGRVVAVVGGREQKEQEGYTLNRAYQAFRQPGSSLKPLVVYTPMFERGLRPEDKVLDEKFEDGPRNAEGTYEGEITVRRAVEVSKNTIAWKLFQELTPRVGLSYLYQMNFSRLCESDYVPAASLGGLTYGASPVEMASAYAALANDGIYRRPTCIIKIMDARGNELVGEQTEETRIYKSEAVVIMTDVLQGVMQRGTGRKLALSGITSAGKTGTTVNRKDGWFCGYTGYYTTAVWVGNDMPEKINGLSGNSYPGAIWKQYMKEIHAGLPDRKFEAYEEERQEPEEEIIWGEEERKQAEAVKEETPPEETVQPEQEEETEEMQQEEITTVPEETEKGGEEEEELDKEEGDASWEDIEREPDQETDAMKRTEDSEEYLPLEEPN